MAETPKQNCYLLDTSVILDDPLHILRLYDNGENAVVITDIVLAELNNKKDDTRGDAGFRAREFFRFSDNEQGKTIEFSDLPECIQKCSKLKDKECDDRYYRLSVNFPNANLQDNQVGSDIPLYIIYRKFYEIAKSYRHEYGLNDAKIGEIAQAYKLTLLTNDISFKIASEVQGISTQSIRNARVERPEEIEFSYTYTYQGEEPVLAELDEHLNFEQMTFVQEAGDNTQIYETGLQKYALMTNHILEWCDFDKRFGEFYDDNLIRPINLEQKFYFTILTHPQNYITVVSGATGSGKTLIALQAGLELLSEGIVEGIIYARNTVTANDQHSELGFRKGDEGQKLGYFMYPLYSAINYTIEHMKKRSIDSQVEYTGNINSMKQETATESFMVKHNIEVMDIAHLRGTTISKKFVIIDEAQNLTSATLKLIGTRMGDETRLVVMGDPNQIDHPFLSKRRNALVALLQKAKTENYIAGVQLRHTIRSEIANWFDKNF